MTEYTKYEQLFLDRIALIKGVTFLGFETIKDLPLFRASTLISRLDWRNHSQYDIDDWVMRTLKRERIKDEFFLGVWSGMTYARVTLERPLWWANEILHFTHNLRLISLEQDYWLQVGNGEYDGFGDSYVNYKEAYRWIQPPANSPSFWG